MNKCALSDFKEILTPWLSNDYLQKVNKVDKCHISLLFTDGISDLYQIEECTEEELAELLQEIREKGIETED